GGVHRLVRLLGEGGQGAVFRTAEPTLAVKWIEDRSAARRERLRTQLQRGRSRLALPEMKSLPVAHPVALLRAAHVGYVMKFLSGMIPLSGYLKIPPGGTKEVHDWYVSGGGLRRRLRLLARTAEVLASLHANALVYGDPSPNNVFVSEDVSAEEVYL